MITIQVTFVNKKRGTYQVDKDGLDALIRTMGTDAPPQEVKGDWPFGTQSTWLTPRYITSVTPRVRD